MKNTVFKLSLLSLSLVLCACSSSAPKESENTADAEEETGTEVAEEESVPASAFDEMLSSDSFSTEFAETENEYGIKRAVITLTNNTAYPLVNPKIELRLRNGVTANDLQALMPDGFEVDQERIENFEGRIPLHEGDYCLNPSETSHELTLAIPDKGGDMTPYPMDELPYPKEMFDLMEVAGISGILVVDGKPKQANVFPKMMGDIPIPVLQERLNTFVNEVPEEIKDKIVVPDDVAIYLCESESYDGRKWYRITFYNVTEDVEADCVNRLKEMYPLEPESSWYLYYGKDSEGFAGSLEANHSRHTLVEIIDLP